MTTTWRYYLKARLNNKIFALDKEIEQIQRRIVSVSNHLREEENTVEEIAQKIREIEMTPFNGKFSEIERDVQHIEDMINARRSFSAEITYSLIPAIKKHLRTLGKIERALSERRDELELKQQRRRKP